MTRERHQGVNKSALVATEGRHLGRALLQIEAVNARGLFRCRGGGLFVQRLHYARRDGER